MSDEDRPSPGQLAGSESNDTPGVDEEHEEHPPGLVASLRRRLHLVKDDEPEVDADPATTALPRQQSGSGWSASSAGDGQGGPTVAAATPVKADDASIDTDPGWVFHEKDAEGGGYSGWLYHFADGEVVDQEGAPVDLTRAAPEVESETETEAEVVDVPQAAVAPEAEAVEEPADPDVSEAPPEAAGHVVEVPQAAAEPEPESETEEQAGPEAPDAPEAADEVDEVDEVVTVPQATTAPDPESEPEPEPDPEPEAEPAPESESEREPEPAVAAAQDGDARVQNWKASHRRGPADDDLPAYVNYSSGTVLTAVLGAVVLVAGLATVLALFAAITDPTTSHWVRTVVLALVAVAAFAALAGGASSSVTVRDGVLEVARGGRTDKVDLRDPAVSTTSGPDPSSRGWAVRVRRPQGRDIVVRGVQVKREQFARLVEHHQANPRNPTEKLDGGSRSGPRR